MAIVFKKSNKPTSIGVPRLRTIIRPGTPKVLKALPVGAGKVIQARKPQPKHDPFELVSLGKADDFDTPTRPVPQNLPEYPVKEIFNLEPKKIYGYMGCGPYIGKGSPFATPVPIPFLGMEAIEHWFDYTANAVRLIGNTPGIAVDTLPRVKRVFAADYTFLLRMPFENKRIYGVVDKFFPCTYLLCKEWTIGDGPHPYDHILNPVKQGIRIKGIVKKPSVAVIKRKN